MSTDSAHFTKVSIGELPDFTAKMGVDGMEARPITSAIGAQRVGAMHHKLEPNRRQPFGHHHNESEEIYVVLTGSGTIKVGDEDVALTAMDAVRVAPEAMRSFEAGPDGLEFLAIGNHVDNDGTMHSGWWGGPAE